MPTTRFKYQSFNSLSIGNININKKFASLTNNSNVTIDLENINLPITTTFNNEQLGDISTKNTTNIITNDSNVIPLTSTIYSINNEYIPYIQMNEVPEFIFRPPSQQLFVNDEFEVDIYAISTGPRDKYLKSITFKCFFLPFSNSSIKTGIEFIGFTNSDFYSIEELSSSTIFSYNISTFKITENFPNTNLKKSYTDLYLGAIRFRVIERVTEYTSIEATISCISQVEILEILDGDNINYLSSVEHQEQNILVLENQFIKCAKVKNYFNTDRTGYDFQYLAMGKSIANIV